MGFFFLEFGDHEMNNYKVPAKIHRQVFWYKPTKSENLNVEKTIGKALFPKDCLKVTFGLVTMLCQIKVEISLQIKKSRRLSF